VQIAQRTPIGNAENAIGTLTVKRADGRVEQLRGRGFLPLHEGDECKTERASRAFIRLADGTQLAMNEGTTLTVRARRERGGGIVRLFKLLLGELWMKTPGATPIEVETPVATAAIKGTEFNLQVLPDGKSILTVLDGLVELKNEFCSPCPVSAARQSFGERGKRCTEPVPVDPAAVIAWIGNVVR
jgi:ferric-dicitrate binding protein FerR (iron transport regulator)